MIVRAIRGVCVGVADHMTAGDVRDLDAPLAKYLISIGAVETVPDAPAAVAERQPEDTKPAKAGKKE